MSISICVYKSSHSTEPNSGVQDTEAGFPRDIRSARVSPASAKLRFTLSLPLTFRTTDLPHKNVLILTYCEVFYNCKGISS